MLTDSESTAQKKHDKINLLKSSRQEVIIKIQETCNLNCKYCYMYNLGNNLHQLVPPSMPMKTCENIAELVGNGLRDNRHRRVNVILHGGEPMLMPAKRFRERMRAITAEISNVAGSQSLAQVGFSLQTNGTLVTDEWLDCLHDFGIRASVTIDGPKEFHDQVRIDKAGRGSYDQMMDGVRKLLEAGKAGYIKNIGGLMVINPDMSGAAAFLHMVEEVGIDNFDFLLPICNWETATAQNVEGVTEFLTDAFRAWTSYDRAPVRVRIFDSAIKALLRQVAPSDPISAFKKDDDSTLDIGGFFVVLESDGSIMPDESLRETYSDRFCDLKIGEMERTFESILSAEPFQNMMQDHYAISTECAGCTLRLACRSGARLGRLGMRYSQEHSFSRKSVYCETFKEIFILSARLLNDQGIDHDHMNLH